MTELLTAAQMRAIEQAAIASGEVTGLELMERAGGGLVEAVFEEWPDLATGAHHAVVLCGPGNNGGDGFVVARLLAQAGWQVEVFLYGDPARLPPDARANHDRWTAMGAVQELTENAFRQGEGYADIYVDALFGAGLSRSLSGEAAAVMRNISGVNGDDYWRRTVAVDTPSGMCLDSGRILARIPQALKRTAIADSLHKSGGARPYQGRAAALTVTFDLPKAGHFLNDGPDICGKLVIKDIGLENWRSFAPTRSDGPRFVLHDGVATGAIRPPKLRLIEKDALVPDCRNRIFTPPLFALRKHCGAHQKFDYGHALVLTGGAGRTGAARLAARGALRIGAGLVTLGVPPSAQMEVAMQITALMLARVADGDGLNALLEDARITALCIGPGLGLDDHAGALVDTVLGAGYLRLGRRVVFDADALTLIAQQPDRMAALNENAVLTPHGGEFKRLFPDIAARLAAVPDAGPAYSKVDATRAAAARCGAVVLFKGVDTVIAHPDGRASLHSATRDRAAPWLSTAGAGDVLAGFITGLLARGLDPMQAAELGAWVHVECARAFGPGLIAEDLPDILPDVLSEHV